MIKGKCCIFGGGSLYRLPVYNLLAEKINCDFYIGETSTSSGIVTYDYSKLKSFSGEIRHGKIIGNVFYQKKALRLLFKPYEYYIEGGPYNVTTWLLILLTRFSRKKVVSWSHGIYGREKGLRKYLKILYYKLCDLNLVYNERAVSLMVDNGIKRSNVFCVYNSGDSDHDLMIRRSLQYNDIYSDFFKIKAPVAIFVGRITASKKIDLAIRAISELKKRGKTVNLMLVGKELGGADLHNLANELNVEENIYFYGPCYDDKIIGNMFYNAEVCVSPGNVGLTAVSAMTFGCPVISHDNFNFQGPEVECIVKDETGDFFLQDDFVDLADKIEKWAFGNSLSRAEKARRCFAEIDSKWNIHTEVGIFMDIFNEENERKSII